mmetsp:Transcript_35243/g.64426  ORF Transcript_35243/g.64426 Transcript_35243/m.64426 type:complete len:308 (-) Transcript_35243:94-1017(-)
MGKVAKKEKEGDKKKEEKKAAANAAASGPSPLQRLNQLRPQKRNLIPFLLFLAACAWVLLFYGNCASMLTKKKKDCGWPGISETTCRTVACFYSDSSKAERFTIELARPAGQKLGWEVKTGKKGSISVEAIKDGAVMEHNAKLAAGSPNRIKVGDKIVKVDGKSGDDMKAVMRDQTKESLSLEVSRSPGPGVLEMLMPASWRSSNIGQIVASRTFAEMLQKFSYLGGVGIFCWTVSGYPAASLPFYYLLPAAGVAWQSTGCCYNDGVGPDEPHCFKPAPDSVFEMVTKTWERTTRENARNIVNGMLK